MRFKKIIYSLVLIGPVSALPVPAAADVLVMHSGERFNASRLWEEKNAIRFDMNGLIVRVDKSEVDEIIRTHVPDKPPAAPRASHPAPVAEKPAGIMDILPQPDQPAAPRESNRQTAAEAPDTIWQPYTPADPNVWAQPTGSTRSSSPPPVEPSVSMPEPSRLAGSQQQTKTSASRSQQPHAPTAQSTVSGTGLDGIQWQMRPADLQGIIKTSTEDLYGGIDQYQFAKNHPKFGRVALDGLLFGFWRNSLYSITCWIAGRPGYERLKAEVLDVYGTERQNRAGLERFIWRDPTSDRFLEFDDQLNTGIFWMRSRELDSRIKSRY